jgi:iron complex transport system permease protein
VLAVFALGIGQYPVSPGQVIAIVTGQDDSFASVLVLQWRMPRILLALLIGAALGVSGAIFQALTRNPLGSPDVIGFDFGAYTGALIAIAVLGGGYYTIAVSAVVGGLATAVIVYLLSYQNGLAGFRLIIVGIAVGAVLSSVSQWIILKIKLHQAVTAAIWQQGSLNGLEWAQVYPMLGGLVIGCVLLAVVGPQLPILEMGDDAAGALGIRPERARLVYFVIGVLLIAVAAATAGPISFVALAAPQLARRLTGAPGVGLISAAAMGGVLLLSSDLIALTIFAPTELPVGAITVTLGGLYLVYLLIVQARRV